MRFSLVLGCLLIICNLLYSQQTDIKIYMRDQCHDSIYLYNFITLKNENDSTFLYDCSKGQLIDVGVYRLSLLEVGEVTIELEPDITYVDTFFYPSLNELVSVTTSPEYYGFHTCNKLCNGYLVDYYKKGVVRIEGEFNNGIPVGHLKFYYPTGVLQEVRIYSRRYKRFKRAEHYNAEGKLIRVENKGYKVKIDRPSVPNNR